MQLGESASLDDYERRQTAAEVIEEQFRSDALADEKAEGKFTDIAEKRAARDLVSEPTDYDFDGHLMMLCPGELIRLAVWAAGRGDLLPKGYADDLKVQDEGRMLDAIKQWITEGRDAAIEEYIEAEMSPIPQQPAYELEDL